MSDTCTHRQADPFLGTVLLPCATCYAARVGQPLPTEVLVGWKTREERALEDIELASLWHRECAAWCGTAVDRGGYFDGERERRNGSKVLAYFIGDVAYCGYSCKKLAQVDELPSHPIPMESGDAA